MPAVMIYPNCYGCGEGAEFAAGCHVNFPKYKMTGFIILCYVYNLLWIKPAI